MSSSHSLRLTLEASEDIRDILQYSLQAWGPEQQETYGASLDSALQALANFPSIRRSRDELFPGCRSHRAGQYIIYYQVSEGTVTVARVLHARMDATLRFNEPE